jgi:hypothetical protein
VRSAASASFAALAGVMLCGLDTAHAAECSARAACKSRDVVELRDGRVLCGSIVYRDDGHSLIVVDDAHRNQTIAWDDVVCLDQHGVGTAAAPAGPATPAPAHAGERGTDSEDIVDVATYEPSERSVWLEWDVRLAGNTYFKRYAERENSAWSWGMGAGIGFGAALHYAISAAGAAGAGPIHWSDLELGLAGTVTYGTWNQINAGQASVITQDVSLRVGTRFRLGGPDSGILIGIAWLPTYADFYGRQIKTPGAINPLGMRLAFDLGGKPSAFRHAPVFRVALSYLPYVGKLPSMFGVSAGVALD